MKRVKYETSTTEMTSLPARGAWVETKLDDLCAVYLSVAPRKGSVG